MNAVTITPETDAAVRPHGSPFSCVATDFARKLERQRDELAQALLPIAERGEISQLIIDNARAALANLKGQS